MRYDRLKPYSNWTENELKHTLLNHVHKMDVPVVFKMLWKNLINEAFNSKYWDVIEEYNGCTLVQDYFHPCPACFCHDYMWISGHGGKDSDKIFKALMIAEGMPKGKINRRWFGVRVGWIFGFYWKYKIKGTLKKPTKAMIDILKYINNK